MSSSSVTNHPETTINHILTTACMEFLNFTKPPLEQVNTPVLASLAYPAGQLQARLAAPKLNEAMCYSHPRHHLG